jgi:signal transduction histidine kinase
VNDDARTAARRPAPTPHEVRTDLAIAGALLVGTILSESLYRIAGVYDDPAPAWVGPLWALALTAPVAFRRRAPVPAAIVVSLAFFAGGMLRVPEMLVSNIVLFLALYSVGAWVANRPLANAVRIGISGAMLLWVVVLIFQQATDPDALPGFERGGALSPLVAFQLINLLTNVLYFTAAYVFGDHAYRAAIQRAELERRSVELQVARDRAAEQAVALDRVRIARELHDAVAHHVSVIGIQAGAARTVLERDADAARAALGTIESTARSAIDELHRLLGTLRDVDATAEAGSVLGVDRLPELVEQAQDAGTPTTLTVVGEPRRLPELASLNLYRIAQEALTNVRKHAGADARADVRLRYLAEEVELEVSNTGAVSSRRSPGGLGQLGMRERVAASGGVLEVGTRSRGGYLVRARIPAPAQVAEGAAS